MRFLVRGLEVDWMGDLVERTVYVSADDSDAAIRAARFEKPLEVRSVPDHAGRDPLWRLWRWLRGR